MLDDFAGITSAFSLGVGLDDSWDIEIANRNIPVYAFDHTVVASPDTHANLHFLRRKIVPRPDEDGEDAGDNARDRWSQRRGALTF